MSHTTLKSGYAELVDRLNRFPQGAPPSDTLFRILQILFDEKEARLVALLPLKPFTAETASRAWKLDLVETSRILEALAERALLVDMRTRRGTVYTLPPPMAGFFEFSLMRVRGDIDQQALSELFHQYLHVEEEFIRALFTDGQTQLGRVFVNEQALSAANAVHVLDYERAGEVIRTARHRGVGMCYCRHKMSHLGRACDAPLDICMTFNASADSLIRHGHARAMDVQEGLDLLEQARDRNLVQFGENVREGVNFICHCCGCCCEAMIAARKFGRLNPVHTTNFLPEVEAELCNGCGRCVDACPVEALTVEPADDPNRPDRRRVRLDEDICLGCGVCVRACARGGLSLKSRAARVITPVNSTHRVVLMAIERGDLQHLIFDQRVFWNHRALAAVLGVILRLPPLKQALATRQFRSQYLEKLITGGRRTGVDRSGGWG
jgi:ferredoxin